MANKDRAITEYKTVDLLQAREQFDRAQNEFLQAAGRCDGPAWIPGDFILADGETPCAAMVARWRDIYKPGKGACPELAPTGMLCASEEAFQSALALNAAKENLKLIIVEMRKTLKPDAMREQMRTVAMSDYDLNKVYQKIMCFAQPIKSISWTWSVGHKKVEPVKVVDLLEKAESMGGHGYAAINAKLIDLGIALNSELARVKVRNFQLRANTHIREGQDWKSKLFVTPGPILLKQASMPSRIWWKPKPVPNEDGEYVSNRQKRSDQALSDTPAITVDGIDYYQYLRHPVTNKRKAKDV